MSGFSREWLDLRESVDAASRARGIVQTLNRVEPDRPLHITDLAAGTGGNLRYLSRLLGGAQTWCLVDHDQALLDAIPNRVRRWAAASGASITHSQSDLRIVGRGFSCRACWMHLDLAGDLPALALPERSLVSASALLDLVSESWLQALARRCVSVHAPVLFALTYDGRMRFDPPEPEDEDVRALVNRHQMTDKGFGVALGPTAGAKAVEILELLGYRVRCEPSDWHLEPSEGNLQAALLDGWLAAAAEIAPDETRALGSWAQRRREHVACGRSALDVGHVDILGWLPGRGRPD